MMRSAIISALVASGVELCTGLSSIAVPVRRSPVSSPIEALKNFDPFTNDRLPWIENGYGTWEWRGHDINYIEIGDKSKPALLLIHGFGASSYHFRYNIPELAKDYHVFAFDMLGFGLSSKPIQDYGYEIWRDQTVDFVSEVIGKKTTLAGNSLGGFTALYAATSNKVKSFIDGCILLNSAGTFKNPNAPDRTNSKKNEFIEKIKEGIQRLVIAASFVYTKRPQRIEQVLKNVYPVNTGMVDSELVESIQRPALDPNAAEVFHRVITRAAGNNLYVDELLEQVDCPILLCWGESDPWMKSENADRIQALYPASKRVSIDAGHCPHDEAPEAVNSAIREFVQEVSALK